MLIHLRARVVREEQSRGDPERLAMDAVGGVFDTVREGGADVLDLEQVDEELGQLVHAVGGGRAVLADIATHDAEGETTCSASPKTRSKRRASAVPWSA